MIATCTECRAPGVRVYHCPKSTRRPKFLLCNRCVPRDDARRSRNAEHRREWVPLVTETDWDWPEWQALPEADPILAPVWRADGKWSL